MKEILLYSNINCYSASDFITAMADAVDKDIVIRINADGGDPIYGFGMIAKIREHKSNVLIKVDGGAHSMFAFMLCYVEDSEAVEMSEFVIHRAAYPDWFENDPDCFTTDVQAEVKRVNDFLRKAFEAKIDVPAFEKLSGMKVKDIFSLDDRLEYTLTAADAKKIGLINRVVKITPQKSAEIKTLKAKMAAKYSEGPAAKDNSNTNKSKKNHKMSNTKKMNLKEFERRFPKTFAAAVKSGADKEFDRINACLVYVDIDAKGVKKAIKSREPLSATAMAEFSMKVMNGKKLKDVKDDSKEDLTTDEDETENLSEAEKKKALFAAELRKKLNLKPTA